MFAMNQNEMWFQAYWYAAPAGGMVSRLASGLHGVAAALAAGWARFAQHPPGWSEDDEEIAALALRFPPL